MEVIELVPDAKNLMESTRSIGYSLSAAVADILDNSITAKCSQIRIYSPIKEIPYFAVFDDGFGMTRSQLITAMRYGSHGVDYSRDKSDLGRFGLGLKMASLSQCRCLTVISKTASSQLVGACWDLDYIAETKTPWALKILSIDEIAQQPYINLFDEVESGTLVLWAKLDLMMQDFGDDFNNKVMNKRLVEVQNHLSLVFHRYLDNDLNVPRIQMFFNDRKLEPIDPFLIHKSTRPFENDSFRFMGERIYIQPFILPHPNFMTSEEKEAVGDLQAGQGFYIYRNYRLIIWGTWFRLNRKTALSKLARVRVDIPASANIDKVWSLDVKKSSATIPESLKDPLQKVIANLQIKSGNVWTKRAKKEITTSSLWLRKLHPNKEVTYEINEEHPLVSAFIANDNGRRQFVRVIGASLPMNSLYADMANDAQVETSNSMDSIKNSLAKAKDPDLQLLYKMLNDY